MATRGSVRFTCAVLFLFCCAVPVSAQTAGPVTRIAYPANDGVYSAVDHVSGICLAGGTAAVSLVYVSLGKVQGGVTSYWSWAGGSWEAGESLAEAAGTSEWSVSSNLPAEWVPYATDGTRYFAGAYGVDATGAAGTIAYSWFQIEAAPDTTPPVCAVTQPLAGSQYPGPAALAGTASDAHSGVAFVDCFLARRSVAGGAYEYWDWAGNWLSAPTAACWYRAQGTTDWTVTTALPVWAVADYYYGVGARATDGAGNLAYAPAVQFRVYEGTAPTCAITTPVAGTQYPAPTALAGTAADPGSGVAFVDCVLAHWNEGLQKDEYWDWSGSWVLDGGAAGVRHRAEGTTSWSAVAGLPPLLPGYYCVYALATDACGNVGSAAPVSFRVHETSVPTCTIAEPIAGTMYPGPAAIRGTAADPDSGVAFVDCVLAHWNEALQKDEYWNWSGAWVLDGGAAGVRHRAEGTTSWSAVAGLPPLLPGYYRVYALATDVCGNVGTAPPVSLRVHETSVPTCTIAEPIAGTMYPGPAAIRGTAADPDSGVASVDCVLFRYSVPLSTYEYWNWAGAWVTDSSAAGVRHRAEGTTSWSATSGLPAAWEQGDYFVWAGATDAVGNLGTAPNVHFTVADSTAPTVAVTYPVSGATYYPALPRIEGTAADVGSGVAAVYCLLVRSRITMGEYWDWEARAWVAQPGSGTARLATGTSQWSVSEGLPASWETGNYEVWAVADDAAGNRGVSARVLFQVGDTTAPALSAVTATPAVLRNTGKLETVTVAVTATDDFDPAPVSQITGVTCNQPVKGPEAGRKADWRIVDALTVQLKATTASRQDRLYTIHVRCTDAAGNASTGSVTVLVPAKPGGGKK